MSDVNDWGYDRTTALDEEDDGIDASPMDVDEDPGRLFGLDVDELAAATAADAIRQVVQRTVSGAVQKAVTDAAERALDEHLIEELHRRAAAAAARAIDSELAALEQTGSDESQLYYGSLDEFVRDYLTVNYRRRIDGKKAMWAADWWNYPEATIRLDALWRAWEQLRLDPTTGMSVWWRDHADHHMQVLFDPQGPFAAAGEGPARVNTNEKGAPLPYKAPPVGLYPDLHAS